MALPGDWGVDMPMDGHGTAAVGGRGGASGGMSRPSKGLLSRGTTTTAPTPARSAGRPLKTLAILCSLVGLFLLAGCAGGKVSRYYVLTPIAVGKLPHDPNGIAIGIGPVVIPQYLDRQGVVTRTGSNRIDVARY